MKKFTFICSIFLSAHIYGQNVGVGTTSPTEKLDVNGNVNVSGNLKINNVGGNPGQVLMTNGNGATAWADFYPFQNFASFSSPGAGQWTVPAGVTKVCVEIWGAGGGGNYQAGGGGGAYAKAVFTVTPSSVVTFSIGTGGNGAFNATATTGGTTTVAVNSISIDASGGGGAIYNSVVYTSSGAGGTVTISGSFQNYIAVDGISGGLARKTYMQFNATTFYEQGLAGKGGDAGNAPGTGGDGAEYLANSTSGAMVSYAGVTAGANQPGGGGGSGFYHPSVFFGGSAGANGKVIIRY